MNQFLVNFLMHLLMQFQRFYYLSFCLSLSCSFLNLFKADQRVQNYFVWLDDKTISSLDVFFIFSFRYESIYAVLFTIEKVESRTKSREFLLPFWSKEVENPKAWMRFIKFYRCPCFFMLLFRLVVWHQKLDCNHWKTLEDRLCQGLASLQSLFIPFQVDPLDR